jgi:aryl-alcohol dehydrogenase-like predicted oxidoreductase
MTKKQGAIFMSDFLKGAAQKRTSPPHEGFNPLGHTGLWCHPFGFGCYRIEDDSPTHEASLRAYLESGGNLIDTSANYTDGGAERAVGRVLKDISRENVIVVTKGGYIQGENMHLAQARAFPEVVRYGPGLWHCMHPEFLETQIARSCARMEIETIDVFLLHNPEYFLNYQAKRGITADDHAEFYRRIRAAFAFLETQVAAGTIGCYGISSNNYPLPVGDETHASVARCLEQAESLSKDHHFKVVQFPLNLFESGCALEKSNRGVTPLEFCHANGIGTLANRPLNAFFDNQMFRLADFAKPGGKASRATLDLRLAELQAHERALQAETDVALMGDEGIAAHLNRLIPQISSLALWEQNAYRVAVAPIRQWLGEAGRRARDERAFAAWTDAFLEIVNPTLGAIADYAAAQGQPQSDAIRQRLFASGYPLGDATLSQMAINTLRSLPQLSCTLVGMRQPQYVADVLALMELPKVDGKSVLERFCA